MKPPEELDKMADLVLNYRPKPKSKASRKRARKSAKKAQADVDRQRKGMRCPSCVEMNRPQRSTRAATAARPSGDQNDAA
jgi:hypothetical protein